MLVYGKNVAYDLLNSDTIIKKIYIADHFNDQALLNLIYKKKIDPIIKKKYELDRLTEGLNQGIVLEIKDYEYKDISSILDLESALIVILDHLEDPHNFGAIIRSCEAAGVDAIIIPKDRSVEINGTVMKTSAGTLNKVNIIMVTNLVNTIKQLKENGYWIVGTDMVGDDYSKINYKGKTAIICGNEGKGMSKLVHENCDFIASIPMKGTVNSLNASVATAIIVFEAVKQRSI